MQTLSVNKASNPLEGTEAFTAAVELSRAYNEARNTARFQAEEAQKLTRRTVEGKAAWEKSEAVMERATALKSQIDALPYEIRMWI